MLPFIKDEEIFYYQAGRRILISLWEGKYSANRHSLKKTKPFTNIHCPFGPIIEEEFMEPTFKRLSSEGFLEKLSEMSSFLGPCQLFSVLHQPRVVKPSRVSLTINLRNENHLNIFNNARLNNCTCFGHLRGLLMWSRRKVDNSLSGFVQNTT